MSQKITKQEFLQRFYRSYPDAKIQLLDYTAISNPVRIKCLICGKELIRSRARQLLNGFNCCNANLESRNEKIQRFYIDNKQFQYIKEIDKDHVIIKHLVCGNQMKRDKNSCLDNPYSCIHCNTIKTSNMRPIQEVQKILDQKFDKTIKILEYNGFEKENTYRCQKCGMIFKQKQNCLLQSRGCPSCDRWQSLGEKKIIKLLQKNNINYKQQYSVKELPQQRFDFAILNDNNEPVAFIEVQGEGHYYQRAIFDDVKIQQQRDNRKREYCKKYNIPLYELIYLKGKFKNLEILPFQFNDYPCEEE